MNTYRSPSALKIPSPKNPSARSLNLTPLPKLAKSSTRTCLTTRGSDVMILPSALHTCLIPAPGMTRLCQPTGTAQPPRTFRGTYLILAKHSRIVRSPIPPTEKHHHPPHLFLGPTLSPINQDIQIEWPSPSHAWDRSSSEA
jgi:hypothetical protein